MQNTCILQDTERMGNTLGLLDAAGRLHGKHKFRAWLVQLEDPGEGSGTPFNGRFHHLVRVDKGLVDRWDARALAQILEDLYRNHCFDSILIPGTSLGKMVAPRLARRLGTGLVSGVTDLRPGENSCEIIRPVCAGKQLEGVCYKGPGPLVMSIRPNAFEYSPEASSGSRLDTQVSEYHGPAGGAATIKQIHEQTLEQTRDIRDYEVLVSGGGGVKDRFADLYPLAEALNGTVAASRKLVDQGIAPRAIQVGQSGKTVSPRLYMALGIHGSMQHLAGMGQADTIISVNTSPHAPICSLSDIVVQGDAGKFIDKLMEKISKRRSEDKGS